MVTINFCATWTDDPELEDRAICNLVDALPSMPDRPMSTVEIWHRAKAPKPTFTRSVRLLKNMAAEDFGVMKYGKARGKQKYRWEPFL